MLLLRSIIFAVLIPGTVAVTVPYLMVTRHPISITPIRWSGLIPILFGAAVLTRCIYDFAVSGRGTLAPIDPPSRLVVRGLYRYVRNPMYVGCVTMLLGETLLFGSFPLLIHTLCTFICVHLFVIFYEEPVLRRQFGESYIDYTRTVHRWIPRIPHK
jgi:protein-S-isoprenylcysteine O-methyltransferase Ste14